MNRTTKFLIGATAVVGVAAGGTGLAVASSSDDGEAPITGPALEQATEAALAHTGEGRVTDTEVEDEDSFYEVEITLDDGSEIDVQLDESFNVVGSELENGDEADND